MTFLLRRLLLSIPVLFGVTTLTFFLIHFVPGDPVDIMLGEQANDVDRTELRRELGLDRPLHEQYLNFFENLFRLDLGKSLHSRRPVTEELAERIPATLELSFSSMLLALIVGLPLGTLAAAQRGSWLDRCVQIGVLIGLSTPSFWIGPLLILVFALTFDIFPVSERGGLEHLALPCITLAFGLCAVLIQMTRASLGNVIHEDYIQVARAKGLTTFQLYFKHALSNALIPIITIVGLQFGALLTGTVIVETIFDWPGVGTLLYQAIQQRNYPLIQGCVLLIAGTYVMVNFLTDIAYTLANPQLRMK